MLKVVKKPSIGLPIFHIVLKVKGDFPPVGEMRGNSAGRIFLSGGRNLTRSDFNHSKLFQSQKSIL